LRKRKIKGGKVVNRKKEGEGFVSRTVRPAKMQRKLTDKNTSETKWEIGKPEGGNTKAGKQPL